MNFPPFHGTESELMKICRWCLTKQCLKDISKEYCDVGKREVYQEMIKDVFNIQILKGTSVNHYICEECIKRLRDSSSFKEMVLKNQEMYLECLRSYQKTRDIKLELPSNTLDFDSKFNDDSNESCGDNGVMLSNQNDISYGNNRVRKKTLSEHKIKSKKRKKQEMAENDIPKLPEHNAPKLTEHRGTGPILRENSLKLLANSSAAVFQWNKSRYTCFCCKEPFSDINSLKNHTNECHTLEEVQKRIINQQNRLVKVEITSLNCKICGQHLTDLETLKTHLLNHNIVVNDHLLIPFRIENKLKCQICSEPFNLFRLLNIHMNKHYQKHVCHICGSGFSNLVFLNLHRTRSHRQIKCQKCEMVFKSRTEKRIHETEIHGVKFERRQRFPCPFCPERFFQENLKVKHMVEEHNMKKPEFGCQFCSKTFLTRSLLNSHVKVVHMKERSHECHVCHSVFYTKSDVTRHSVTHTGEKNFVCSFCSNSFATKDSLRRHMKRSHDAH